MGIKARIAVVVPAVVVALLYGSVGCGSPQAAYPSGPVTMVVAWASGSSSDLGARALAEGTQKHLGQPIVVQNVAGAGGATGATQIAQAKADGYNILFGTASLVTQPLFEDVPYNPVEHFAPVLQVGGYPTLIVVRADSPLGNAREMIDYAKKNPGKINYSSSGFGSIHHMLVEMMSEKAGIQLTHVPFKALSEGITALLGGHIDAATTSFADAAVHIKEGRLKALGIFMPERDKDMPDIPTMKEQGVDVTAYGWWAIAAPKGTPDPVIQKLHDAFKKGIAEPGYVDYMTKRMISIPYLGTKETAAKWKTEFESYATMAKTIKAK